MRKSTTVLLASLGLAFNMTSMTLALLLRNYMLVFLSMTFVAICYNIVLMLTKELDPKEAQDDETKAS